ncbi:hypothetical protein [Microbacterium sp.]|uniref:hypothetical protein n=1 Tax=Microbacterium sp. TaxID=51671 RepID=UPI003A8FDB4D
MATKHTPISVQNELTSKIHGFHARAKATKDAYYQARRDVLANDRLSPAAQHDDLALLTDKTADTLKGILEEQQRYVDGLKATIEKELYGGKPMDANSIMLRRDAADRARKLGSEREALDVLRDAARDGDDSMAHAIGHIGRQKGWIGVMDAYQVAQPEAADSAMALAWVEDATSDVGYRLATGAAYSAPLV